MHVKRVRRVRAAAPEPEVSQAEVEKIVRKLASGELPFEYPDLDVAKYPLSSLQARKVTVSLLFDKMVDIRDADLQLFMVRAVKYYLSAMNWRLNGNQVRDFGAAVTGEARR